MFEQFDPFAPEPANKVEPKIEEVGQKPEMAAQPPMPEPSRAEQLSEAEKRPAAEKPPLTEYKTTAEQFGREPINFI